MARRASPWLAGLILLAATGCRSHDRVVHPVDAEPNAEEQVLLQRLTRDPSLIVETYERDSKGQLLVTTIQGSTRIRYLFTPEGPGVKTLNLHRIDDRSRLVEGTDQ